jgi:hypothetical protein
MGQDGGRGEMDGGIEGNLWVVLFGFGSLV